MTLKTRQDSVSDSRLPAPGSRLSKFLGKAPSPVSHLPSPVSSLPAPGSRPPAPAPLAEMSAVDRTLAAFDGDEIVANGGAYTFELTVPGGARVPTAGVTVVGVRATHRRRGLLTRMMDEQLDDVARRGEPLAALTASESSRW